MIEKPEDVKHNLRFMLADASSIIEGNREPSYGNIHSGNLPLIAPVVQEYRLWVQGEGPSRLKAEKHDVDRFFKHYEPLIVLLERNFKEKDYLLYELFQGPLISSFAVRYNYDEIAFAPLVALQELFYQSIIEPVPLPTVVELLDQVHSHLLGEQMKTIVTTLARWGPDGFEKKAWAFYLKEVAEWESIADAYWVASMLEQARGR